MCANLFGVFKPQNSIIRKWTLIINNTGSIGRWQNQSTVFSEEKYSTELIATQTCPTILFYGANVIIGNNTIQKHGRLNSCDIIKCPNPAKTVVARREPTEKTLGRYKKGRVTVKKPGYGQCSNRKNNYSRGTQSRKNKERVCFPKLYHRDQ